MNIAKKQNMKRPCAIYELRSENGRLSYKIFADIEDLHFYLKKDKGKTCEAMKPVKSAVAYITNTKYELLYEGAKEMLLVEDVDNKDYLCGLFQAICKELPNPKPKRKLER